MSNRAAIIHTPKAPLVIEEVEKYTPGPQELLIKNTSIAFNPIEWKVARLAILPIEYPAILGFSFGGTVEAIGSDVTNFHVGERVATSGSGPGNKYGAYQLYALSKAESTIKLPDNVSMDAASSVMINFKTVAAILTATAGLDSPKLEQVPAKGKKVLIYGGTSSVGSLAIQYATQAGYTVISTTSPKHEAFVSTLGAAKLIDHTQTEDALREALIAEGPYQLVVDTISLGRTVYITADVLKAQGGGTLYTLQPPFGPETLPEGVTRHFAPYTSILAEPEHKSLLEYLANDYLPKALAEDKLKPIPIEKVNGGLAGVDAALTKGFGGLSGVKMVLNPQG
ncbi:alcohol dehydrogenase GroES-like domain-containing protein [Microthyrium microscopicum]|uniref:Alcohol dehydrogenase GroES-like domain-containing protein n=1 Tax=Microthyrium microscopicum TaxID=703497 RepID=A0A6A6U6D8_9PEZI|nr:alcohol dehydrogenase GroES-like domain-containing protein [Microthyrium microscopicum]